MVQLSHLSLTFLGNLGLSESHLISIIKDIITVLHTTSLLGALYQESDKKTKCIFLIININHNIIDPKLAFSEEKNKPVTFQLKIPSM